MKTRYQIFMNGRFLEEYTNESDAIRNMEKYRRQDRYEQSIGYSNPLPDYEIRKIMY